MMSRNLAVLIALTVLCSSLTAHSGDSPAAQGAAMLQQARTISEATLDQSLTQSGRLTVRTGPKPLEGQYTYASSGSVWRDEVLVAGFKELRVRTGDQEKIQRSFDYDPLAIYAAFEAVRPISWLQLLPDERVTGVKSEKVARQPTKCVKIQAKHGDRSVCIYDDGTLAALRSSPGWNYEYSDYSTFANAHVAASIRGMENGSLIFELNMNAAQVLTTGTDVQDDIINPTLILGWCKNMVRPAEDNKIPPHYPEAARQSRTQGTVDVYGVIAADGKLTKLATVRSAGPSLDKSSLDAISQWTYHPAMCGATPISSETVISIHYTLSP